MVHGTLADYRLGRLIKYSFYKNISFACMFFFFQFFNGWSGQARRAAAPPRACGAGSPERACCGRVGMLLATGWAPRGGCVRRLHCRTGSWW